MYELADNGVDVFIIDDITLISGLYVYNQEFSGMTEKEAINLSISILGTLAKSKNVWVILNVEKCLRDIPDEKILDDPNELLQFNLVATAGLILHHDYDNKKGFEKEIKEGLIKVTKNRLLGDSNYKGFKTFHDPKTNRTWSNDKLESRKHNS